MIYPKKCVMSIKLVHNSTVAIPWLKEFQESVKTKAYFSLEKFRCSSVPEHSRQNGLSNCTEDYCHSTPIPSLPIQGRGTTKKMLLGVPFLYLPQIQKPNWTELHEKRAGNITDFRLVKFRSHIPKNIDLNIPKYFCFPCVCWYTQQYKALSSFIILPQLFLILILWEIYPEDMH